MSFTINKLVEEDKAYHSPVLQVRGIFHNLRFFLSFQLLISQLRHCDNVVGFTSIYVIGVYNH